MISSPLLGLPMKALDVLLELLAIDSPDTAAADLDCGECSRAHECIGLGNAHVEVGRDLFQGQETWLDLRRIGIPRCVCFPLPHAPEASTEMSRKAWSRPGPVVAFHDVKEAACSTK